jgi:hypothetical protein
MFLLPVHVTAKTYHIFPISKYTKNKSFITQSLGREEDSQPLNTKYTLDNP